MYINISSTNTWIYETPINFIILLLGFRPNRPGFDYNRPGYSGYSGYSGSNLGNSYPGSYRPGYNNQYRPGFDRPYSGSAGNYFGGYGDGYSDNFRLLGRKVGEIQETETKA